MLVRELDGQPLALATAGAYLDQVARLFTSVQAVVGATPKIESGTRFVRRPNTLFYMFDHVKQQNDLSAKLLCFWAYFDSQDLWLELLQHSDSNDPDWVRELTKDEVSFHQALWASGVFMGVFTRGQFMFLTKREITD
ncbi:kinesin light chain 1 protein [Rutstroemia sp. NJR-2017a BBW]|nr:kinesin light chain 1 protein [Rutstroemia sp. NJR-2017a BBW]